MCCALHEHKCKQLPPLAWQEWHTSDGSSKFYYNRLTREKTKVRPACMERLAATTAVA